MLLLWTARSPYFGDFFLPLLLAFIVNLGMLLTGVTCEYCSYKSELISDFLLDRVTRGVILSLDTIV